MSTSLDQSQEILEKIMQQRPAVAWIIILSVDGLIMSAISPALPDNEGVMGDLASAWLFSLSERIVDDLDKGQLQFATMSFRKGMLFTIPLEIGGDCFLAFLIDGKPVIDDVLQYLEDSGHLAALQAIWK
ncbi:MAG: roadblock/LC7 domain-containing protein [Aggregatilineales bacterium]